MKGVEFSHEHSLVSHGDMRKTLAKLKSIVHELQDAQHERYETEYAALYSPFDTESIDRIAKLARTMSRPAPEYLVVVGIGGSNLGTMAVQQLVHGKLHNELTQKTKVLYADTADSDEIYEIKQAMERALKSRKKVILNCVTKSGTTTETLANFYVLLDVLKKHDSKYKERVVITTDGDSPLYELAHSEGFHVLSVPKRIGGRYSVLTSVSLFPLAILGIDIKELAAGARDMSKRVLSGSLERNPSALAASIRYIHAHKGKTIQDLFLFGNDFKSLGKWYRQLFAESLGKGCDMEGKVCVGITPTYSIGSTDMHSIAQLYLGGPFDKLTTFVHVLENRKDITVPQTKVFKSLLPYVQNSSLETIFDAIYHGVTHSFSQGKRPFMEVFFPSKSPYALGQFFYMHIVEVMLLGKLLGVNPFDQPDIESYKTETRKILKR